MKTLIGIVAASLLAISNVNAETIAEAERRLEEKAQSFKNHPLKKYMKPAGYEALWLVLNHVKGDCRISANVERDDCKSQRENAVITMKNYGHSEVTEKDFRNEELYKMAKTFEVLFKAKKKAISKKLSSLPMKEQKPYKDAIKQMRTEVKELRLSLINGN